MDSTRQVKPYIEYFKVYLKVAFLLLWISISLVSLIGLILGIFEGFWKIVPMVLILGLPIWYWQELRRAREKLRVALLKLNEEYGTQFDFLTSPNFSARGESTYFDVQNQKIAFLKLEGKINWVFDFSDIQSWQLRWQETTSTNGVDNVYRTRYSRVHFEFFLKSMELPCLSMAITNHRQGEEWNHRLGLILVQEN